ncbi:C2H2 finger domain protein [Aspergillus sclerotiicarbonarius CBS 121057]|uniref:C2H2 finger domain protein n=1 Tax=Aspergillus sclerotiicarbonarius (strain CBS 121057 / IBT 28362) TaxID=1448318 RepID=A0A319FBG0_ASPSB|nr:C2H2 finger domain protein [Aspergillus sclerotiicarbonarius CBS 121057]
MKSASKHFCCTICQRGFTRIDHLKRHHLRLITSATITRTAPSAGIERSPRLGREAEGDMHVNQQKRNLQCNNDCKTSADSLELDSGSTPSAKREDYASSSERGSIKFLLNGGTDSFTEEFLLPPRSDRARGLEYQNQKGLQDVGRTMLGYRVGNNNQSNCAPAFVESDPAALSFFQDTFLDFFNGPFGNVNKIVETPFPSEPYLSAIVPPVQEPGLALAAQQAYEPEEPFATGLYQAILARAWSVPLDSRAQERLSTDLSFLLTPSRIRKFVSMYLKYWQPSCAMVHLASLNLDTVALPLLAALVFMGAMYSSDEQETNAAKRLLDFVELYIFSSDTYSAESEVASMFCGRRTFDNGNNDWVQFQNFQAGFIIVIVQYWSGSRGSHNRAMENRFSEVIKVARRMGLPKCRHQEHQATSEYQWIQTECRIRTMSIILLLDCAFSFFQNYPCRLTHTEVECDFPCAESLFALEHPYTDLSFQPSRGITISETFLRLFEDGPKDTMPSTPDSTTSSSMASLTVLDMFILIHVLYTFIDSHMTLLGPIIRKAQLSQPKHLFSYDPPEKGRLRAIPEDSMLAGIRMALSRWREHWVTLRSTVSRSEWASMGFFKNGYNFWLVSQLLITQKEGLDVVMRMEVKCEDKLEKLKVLLMDESD